MSEPIDMSEVALADRRLLDNLPVDQLDPIVLGEQANLGHLVLLVNREPVSRQR